MTTPTVRLGRWKAKQKLETFEAQLRRNAWRYQHGATVAMKGGQPEDEQLGTQAVADGLRHAADTLHNFIDRRFVGVERPGKES